MFKLFNKVDGLTNTQKDALKACLNCRLHRWLRDPDFSELELTKRIKNSYAVKRYFYDTRKELEEFADAFNVKGPANFLPDCLQGDVQAFASRALQAHLNGLITEAQFVSVSVLLSAIKQLIVKQRNVAIYRSKNADGTYKSVSISYPVSFRAHPGTVSIGHLASEKDQKENKRLLQKFFYLTDSEYELFEKAMEPFLKTTEGYFYTIPIPRGDPISWSPMYSVLMKKLNVFHPVNSFTEEEDKEDF